MLLTLSLLETSYFGNPLFGILALLSVGLLVILARDILRILGQPRQARRRDH